MDNNIAVLIIFIVGLGSYWLGWASGKKRWDGENANFKETAKRAEAAATRAEIAYGHTKRIWSERDEDFKRIDKAVRLARHWALVKGAAKEDVLDLDNWAEGWIKRRRDG